MRQCNKHDPTSQCHKKIPMLQCVEHSPTSQHKKHIPTFYLNITLHQHHILM